MYIISYIIKCKHHYVISMYHELYSHACWAVSFHRLLCALVYQDGNKLQEHVYTSSRRNPFRFFLLCHEISRICFRFICC